MKVKNLNGTAQNKCKCVSWYAHWEKFSGQKANQCVVIGCKGKPEVGAHVQKDSSADSSWYVIPVCTACNNKRGEPLNVVDEVKLVSANVTQTCGR